jgi:hypothetical protein
LAASISALRGSSRARRLADAGGGQLAREDLEPDVDDPRGGDEEGPHHLGGVMPYALIFR